MWRTLDELRSRARLSDEIQLVLTGMTASRHFRTLTADVSSYVEEALRLGQSHPNTTHGYLFTKLAQASSAVALSNSLRKRERVPPGVPISPGLNAVFDDAFLLRRRTGGRDDYIGARHVVAALLTCDDPSIRTELGLAMEPTGAIDLRAMVIPFVTDILIPAVEEGESLAAWAAIMAERGIPIADDYLSRAAGGQPRQSVGVRSEWDGRRSRPTKLVSTPEPNDEEIEEDEEGEIAAITGHATGQSQATAAIRSDRVVPFQAEAIAGVRNDDPADLSTHDAVGDDAAAMALARVIAARGFRPPLAVGVFGAWGSGKSFLMRRVQTELARLRASPGNAFATHVIGVKFNAWHYVDTDLWANLVGQIFETLEQATQKSSSSGQALLGQLTTARELTLESARALAVRRTAARDAQKTLADAHAMLAERGKTVTARLGKLVSLGDASLKGLAHLKADSDASKLVGETYGKPLTEMAAMWEQPSEALLQMRRDGAVLLEVRRRLGSKKLVIGGLLLTGILVAVPYAFTFLVAQGPHFSAVVEGMQPGALALTGMLTLVGTIVATVTRKAVVARDAVLKAVSAYQAAVAKEAETDAEGLKPAVDALQAARASVVESQAALDAAVAAQAEAAGAFARTSPAERLLTFIREKAAHDGPYRSRQGLIGTIRRDFADLSTLMSDDGEARRAALVEAEERQQAAVDALIRDYPDALSEAELGELREQATPIEDAARPVERIVLYIDDLDRCPAETVIEVLQAVHLLMALPLFVVVVAVDVRWLEGALADRHPQFGGAAGDPVALEYLEKIFQLAIWTEPFASDDASAFVRRRFSLVADGPGALQPATLSAAGTVVEDPDAAARERLSTIPPSPGPAASFEHNPTIGAGLVVTAGEVEFVIRIAGALSTTPRRLLRLTNSYQVARASVGGAATAPFVERNYKGLAALLGLSIAWPECVPEIIAAMEAATGWSEFRENLSPARAAVLDAWLAVVAAEELEVSDLRPWAATTLRFSFSGPGGVPRRPNGNGQ
jgi:hypothetical protein